MALVTLANYDWFKQWEKEPCTRRSDPYVAFKKTIGQRMIDQATELFPSIKVTIKSFYVNKLASESLLLERNK